MKLILLMLASAPALAQNWLNVGALVRIDPATGAHIQSVEAFYAYHRALVNGEFQSRDVWTIQSRAYFAKHLFFQEALRRNVIPHIPHPWLLQTGVGADFGLSKRNRFNVILSPSVRLKTSQTSYTAVVSSFYRVRPYLIFRTSFVWNRALADPSQLGFGVDYHFDFKAKP